LFLLRPLYNAAAVAARLWATRASQCGVLIVRRGSTPASAQDVN
jgi:hypothetical protein